MIALLAVGGAAAIELRRHHLRGKGKDSEPFDQLHAREQHLQREVQRIASELERERSAHRGADQRVQQLQDELGAAQQEAEAVRASHDQLLASHQRLLEQGERDQLEGAERESRLEALLRGLVGAVERLAHGDIDVARLVQEARDMGCVINVDEANATLSATSVSDAVTFTFESKFVLDSPTKMRHLIQAAMQQTPTLPAPEPLVAGAFRRYEPSQHLAKSMGLAWRSSAAATAAASHSAGLTGGGPSAGQLEERTTPRDAAGSGGDTAKAQSPTKAATHAKPASVEGGYISFSSPKKEQPSRRFNFLSLGTGSTARSVGAVVQPDCAADDVAPVSRGREVARRL